MQNGQSNTAQISKTRLVLFIEAFLSVLAGYLSFYIHIKFFGIQLSLYSVAANLIIMTLLLLVCNLSVGLYDVKLRDSIRGIIRRLFVSFAICYFVIEVFISNIFSEIYVSPSFLPMFSAMALFFLIIFRSYSSDVHLGFSAKPKVLVLGSGERASIIEKKMRRQTDRKGFDLVGFVTMKGDTPGVENETIIDINYANELCNYVLDNNISEIIIAPDERRQELPVEQLFNCKMNGVYVSDILDFIERETGQIAVNLIYPSWFIYSNGFESTNHLRNSLDYALNVFLAVIVFLLTWPLMLIAVIAIYLEDGKRTGTSALYSQERVGVDGQLFNILKFRSMRPDAEAGGAQWSQAGDSRITKVGNYLRKYRIDELPQLINVLKGEMGFVGPRPERPEFVKDLAEKIPYYNHRHNVKPGLTGWAQLKYPYGASFEDSFEKVKFDLYYIKHQSVMLDMLILIRTVEVILFGKGR